MPTFSWTGVEPGAVVTWRITGTGSKVVLGPADSVTPSLRPRALAAGSYVLEVRQTDAAGNVGAWAAEPFAVLASSRARTARSALPSVNATRLAPRLGARVASRRPTLRWAAPTRRARLYNVQVFRLRPRDRALVKVLSVFPRATRYRVPRRSRLAQGTCYVWRVWPFRGRTFTARPLGVSNFCVAAAARGARTSTFAPTEMP
jgi:hypothetical protein